MDRTRHCWLPLPHRTVRTSFNCGDAVSVVVRPRPLGTVICFLSSTHPLSCPGWLCVARVLHSQWCIGRFFVQPCYIDWQDAGCKSLHDRLSDLTERSLAAPREIADVLSDRIVHGQCHPYCRPVSNW